MRFPPGRKMALAVETDPFYFPFFLLFFPHPQQQKVSKNKPSEKDNVSLAFLSLVSRSPEC